jgi:hypothetical protein
MTESLYNAMWLASMNGSQQQKSLIEEFASCVSQGFDHGISMEEAFDAFTELHSELDRDSIGALSSQAFAWLAESFACYYNYLSESDDLEAAFGEFVELHQLSEAAALDLARYVSRSAGIDDDDDADAITFPDEAGALDQQQRVEKVEAFLRALARAVGDFTGEKTQPIFPKLKVGDKADPYGNRWGEKVSAFDREKNRYGYNADPNAERELQEAAHEPMVQRVVQCLNNYNRLWTAQNTNESAGTAFKLANEKPRRNRCRRFDVPSRASYNENCLRLSHKP